MKTDTDGVTDKTSNLVTRTLKKTSRTDNVNGGVQRVKREGGSRCTVFTLL